jgi:hypothetical protein
MIEISVELSDIYLTIFDLKYEDIKANTKVPKKAEVD